jgi:mannose-6-phosphate isomerase-like protein (cupin superfamily)
MEKDMRSAIFPLEDARADARTIDGKRFASVAERGSLKLLCSFPLRPNVQSPHDQDELYFVVRGQGVLCHDDKREAFAAGDAMFIAAGTEHRFEDFSDDLTVWVAFFGPKGGEHIGSAA